MVCSNSSCNKKFEKFNNQVGQWNYCSKSCAAKVNNQKFPKRGPGFKYCKHCKRKFKGENLYCSKECLKYAWIKHQPEELLEALRNIFKKLGRTPAKREAVEIESACVNMFGSWNKAIESAGLIPNRSHEHRMYRRAMTKADDGHRCDSISEAIIDNWLTSRGIAHEREGRYPGTNHRADWVLPNGNFIEYFGLAEDSLRYDRDIKIKKGLCHKHKIKLIEIYPADLYPKQNLAAKILCYHFYCESDPQKN